MKVTWEVVFVLLLGPGVAASASGQQLSCQVDEASRTAVFIIHAVSSLGFKLDLKTSGPPTEALRCVRGGRNWVCTGTFRDRHEIVRWNNGSGEVRFRGVTEADAGAYTFQTVPLREDQLISECYLSMTPGAEPPTNISNAKVGTSIATLLGPVIVLLAHVFFCRLQH